MDTNTSWDGRERRMCAEDIALVAETRAKVDHLERGMAEKIEELKSDVEQLTRRVEGLSVSLTSYMEKTPDRIAEKIELLLDDAFPGDPEIPDATPSEKRKLHRKYHAKLIQQAIDEQLRNRSIGEKLMTWVLQNVVTLMALALLAYFNISVPK